MTCLFGNNLLKQSLEPNKTNRNGALSNNSSTIGRNEMHEVMEKTELSISKVVKSIH